MKRLYLLTLLALVAACPIGPTVESFTPARSPHGIAANIRLRDRAKTQIVGELLEVRDSTLLILRDTTRVLLIPIRAIRTGSFPKRGTLITDGDLTRGDREKLRLVSRFPAGLRPELEAQLLAAYGQTEPEKVPQP
jgi:hypothetical protein